MLPRCKHGPDSVTMTTEFGTLTWCAACGPALFASLRAQAREGRLDAPPAAAEAPELAVVTARRRRR